MKFFKPVWCKKAALFRKLDIIGGAVFITKHYRYFAVPSVDECAITTYFGFNGEHWVSSTDDWDSVVALVQDDERGQLMEISRLEVVIGVGSVPKICGDDIMPVARSYDT